MKPTLEEILAEPAGIRLDTWVAKYVMGCQIKDAIPTSFRIPLFVGGEITYRKEPFEWRPWKPSTDIINAWEVAESLQKCGRFFCLRDTFYGTMVASFFVPDGVEGEARGDTAQEAICKAALVASLFSSPPSAILTKVEDDTIWYCFGDIASAEMMDDDEGGA